MQYRPTASELLADVASLLEDEVLTTVSGPLQHRVRVAANLTRIVERELALGRRNDEAEATRLASVLHRVDAAPDDLLALRAALSERLRGPDPLGPAEDRAIYDALLSTLRADLAVSKPGHDAWSDER